MKRILEKWLLIRHLLFPKLSYSRLRDFQHISVQRIGLLRKNSTQPVTQRVSIPLDMNKRTKYANIRRIA